MTPAQTLVTLHVELFAIARPASRGPRQDALEGKLSGFPLLGASAWPDVKMRLPLWTPSRLCARTTSEVIGEPAELEIVRPKPALEAAVFDALVAAARASERAEATLCLRQAVLGCETNVYEHPTLDAVPMGFAEDVREDARRPSLARAFVLRNAKSRRGAGWWIAAALEHAKDADPIEREGAACAIHDVLAESGAFAKLASLYKKHATALVDLAHDGEPFVRGTAIAAARRFAFMLEAQGATAAARDLAAVVSPPRV